LFLITINVLCERDHVLTLYVQLQIRSGVIVVLDTADVILAGQWRTWVQSQDDRHASPSQLAHRHWGMHWDDRTAALSLISITSSFHTAPWRPLHASIDMNTRRSSRQS